MRLSVVGNSGSGKTTLATTVADRLNLPLLELDSLHHQANWAPLPSDELRRRVAGFIAHPTWVVDGNYSTVQDLVWEAADTVAWVDLPLPTTLRQVGGRTVRRIVRREELWNGNRERALQLFDPRPTENLLLWALTRHRLVRRRYEAACAERTDLRWHRLRSRAEVDRFVAGLTEAP